MTDCKKQSKVRILGPRITSPLNGLEKLQIITKKTKHEIFDALNEMKDKVIIDVFDMYGEENYVRDKKISEKEFKKIIYDLFKDFNDDIFNKFDDLYYDLRVKVKI